MKSVRNIATLVYYDGPIVFEARDCYGGHYVGMAVEEENSFVIFGVAPERLQQFKDGSVDLLDLMLHREDPAWYIGTPNDVGYDITEQTASLSEMTDYLPDPGFLMDRVDPCLDTKSVYSALSAASMPKTTDPYEPMVNDAESARLIAAGVPGTVLIELRHLLDVTDDELARLLSIPKGYAALEVLTERDGESVIRIMRLCLLAKKVIGSDSRDWLKKPRYNLTRSALEFAMTPSGAKEVENLLYRIEYGIYS